MGYTGIAFFDMDGVLANCKHRLKFLERKEKDYDTFYSYYEVMKDTPNKAGVDLLKMFVATGYKIIIITSRRESCRDATYSWLKYWGIHIPNEDIYTRGFGDTRKSWDVKLDLMENAIQDNMDIYMSGRSYFVDDYAANCEVVSKRYSSIQALVFGCGRLRDEGGEL